jgi:hypothetical protein
VVEPRHGTWWKDEIRQILAGHDAALSGDDGHPDLVRLGLEPAT